MLRNFFFLNKWVVNWTWVEWEDRAAVKSCIFYYKCQGKILFMVADTKRVRGLITTQVSEMIVLIYRRVDRSCNASECNKICDVRYALWLMTDRPRSSKFAEHPGTTRIPFCCAKRRSIPPSHVSTSLFGGRFMRIRTSPRQSVLVNEQSVVEIVEPISKKHLESYRRSSRISFKCDDDIKRSHERSYILRLRRLFLESRT